MGFKLLPDNKVVSEGAVSEAVF